MPISNVRASFQRGGIPSGAWGFLLVVPSLLLLVAGAKAWMAAAQNKTLTVVSYTEFTRRMPKAGWYKITGGLIDVTKAVYWDANGVCVDVYAPLQPAHGRGNDSSDIYVEIDDPATLSVFQDMTYASKRGGEAGAQRFIAQHLDRLLQRRDVSGLVSYGRRDPIGEWSKAGMDAATLTFLADGWQPNPAFGYAGTAGGLALTVLFLWLLAKGFQQGRH